jgi:hypothetical protein
MGELIKFDAFINIVENINSDIFFLIYIFLLNKRPFSKKTIELYKKTTIDNSTIDFKTTTNNKRKVNAFSNLLKNKKK